MTSGQATTLVTRVGKKSFYTHFAPPHPYAMLTKHFNLTQVCILPFSNIERGNGGVDTYSVDTTIVISCFWHFPPQFAQDCRSVSLHICPCMFFFGDAMDLLRESYVCFIYRRSYIFIYRFLYISCTYLIKLTSQWVWCIGLFLLLCILAPHDSNVAVYTQVCWLFWVLYTCMPMVGLVQARPYFPSSMWISSVAISVKYSKLMQLSQFLLIGTLPAGITDNNSVFKLVLGLSSTRYTV